MEQWETEAYSLHARLSCFCKKKEKTLRLVTQTLQTVPGVWAASYSGGKDSTVMLDLLIRAGWRGPVVWQSYGELETLPGNRKMAEWVADYYKLEVIERQAVGELAVYDQIGYFFLDAVTKKEKEAVRWWWKQAFYALDKFMRSQNYVGHFWGLRTEESPGRKKMINTYGQLFFNKKHGLWCCAPIAAWSAKDVWAYTVSQKLQWNEIYDHGNRERTRNDIVFLAGTGSSRYGAFVYWKQHYPEIFNRIAEQWPEIRNYV